MVHQAKNVDIIEWNDMEPQKFYTYGFLISASTRTLIYPTQLIKTRFQTQSLNNQQYKSFTHALRQITKTEGIRGLYKGLHLNLLQIPVSYVYLTTLEVSKEKLINKAKQTSLPENLIVPSCYMLSGFIASTLSQIIVTPLDVVTQYKQTINASNMNKDANIQGKTTMQITRDLYKSDGFIKGFYRGFTVATLFFGLHSGAIWAVYYQMLESVGSIKFLRQILDGDKHKHEFGLTKYKVTQIAIAGALSSMITNLFLLPLDTLRTRHQLQLKRKVNATVNFKILNTAKSLYREEKIKGFFRGWQPRIAQSTLSPILFLGYELLKELSVSQEAKQLNSKHSFDQ